MKKILSSLLIIFALISSISGCTSKNKSQYNYKGENENWYAEYTVSKLNNRKTRKLTLTYKGNLSDLQSSKCLKYSYKTDINHGEGEIYLDPSIDSKKFTHEVYSESSNIIIKKASSVSVVISLDDKSESIELH
ncbi:hypothetical protein [Clostridium sp. BJN0001]|uniref:hypothetical protein n=1 Tax=Clostridium sp. BJN0001 TaxID=2930219 RepID=UPI001FD5F1E1|nr:hypothetical protein [Clostridium sp. BJN0001]